MKVQRLAHTFGTCRSRRWMRCVARTEGRCARGVWPRAARWCPSSTRRCRGLRTGARAPRPWAAPARRATRPWTGRWAHCPVCPRRSSPRTPPPSRARRRSTRSPPRPPTRRCSAHPSADPPASPARAAAGSSPPAEPLTAVYNHKSRQLHTRRVTADGYDCLYYDIVPSHRQASNEDSNSIFSQKLLEHEGQLEHWFAWVN